MISKIEMRKCCNCGKQYIRTTGGFILKTTSVHCPSCGSDRSKKV